MTKRKVEKTIAYTLLVVVIIFAFYLYNNSANLCINLIIGLFFGMIMSRTAFSFTGNLRSPILSNDYTYTKLFYLMTVITTIGINMIVILGTIRGSFDYASFLDKPTKVSPYFFFAAVVFGFGICLIGSAGSGIIRKAANAKFDFIVTLVFYIIGSVLGVVCRNYALTFFNERSLYMPEMFGWPIAIMIQAILMAIAYVIIEKKSYNPEEDDEDEEKEEENKKIS